MKSSFFLKTAWLYSILCIFTKLNCLVLVVPDFAPNDNNAESIAAQATIQDINTVFGAENTSSPWIAHNLVSKAINIGAKPTKHLIFNWNDDREMNSLATELISFLRESSYNGRFMPLCKLTSYDRKGTLQERVISATMLLAFYIIKCFSCEKEPLVLIGLGTSGSQIVHAVTHFFAQENLKLSQQIAATSDNLLIMDDIIHDLKHGIPLSEEASETLLRAYYYAFRSDLALWDCAKDIILFYIAMNKLNTNNINYEEDLLFTKIFTIGANFSKSLLPNLAKISHYYNFYTNQNLFVPKDWYARRVSNIKVKLAKQQILSDQQNNSFFSPSHEALIANTFLYIFLRIFADDELFPYNANWVKLFLAPSPNEKEVAYKTKVLRNGCWVYIRQLAYKVWHFVCSCNDCDF